MGKLQFDEYFKKFVPDAFAALGICAELWKTEFVVKTWSGTQAEFSVAIINDLGTDFTGDFVIKVIQGDSLISSIWYRYAVKAYETNRTPVKIELPKVPGNYEVIAELHGNNNRVVRSYRPIKMLP